MPSVEPRERMGIELVTYDVVKWRQLEMAGTCVMER